MSDLEPNAETIAGFADTAASILRRSKFITRWRHARQRKRWRHGRPRMVSVWMLPKRTYRVRLYDYRRDYR